MTDITEDMRTLRRLLLAHPDRVHAVHIVDVLNQAQIALEERDCQFNCRAERKVDFIAGWVGGMRNMENLTSGNRPMSRHDAFTAHIKSG